MRKEFKITTKYIMGVMLFFIMVLSGSVTGHAYSDKTLILPEEVKEPSAGCMLVGVRGEYIGETEKALARINEIRKEACEEGVPNPKNPSVKLTMADYEPIKWSAELEEIARIRAAEASLVRSHTRPNGQKWSDLWPPVFSGVAESLAWNGESSMLPGIEQWYEEKELWNVEKDSKGAGHYVSMINPDYTYVGLGCMISECGKYPNTLCGRFGSTKNTVDGTMAPPIKDCIRVIEMQSSAIGNATLKKISGFEEQLKAGDTLSYEFVADTNIDGDEAKVLIMDSVVWTSSDENVATVDNYGNVTGIGGGTVTITAASASGFSASVSLTFTGDKVEPGDITEPEEGGDDPGTEEGGDKPGSGEEAGPGGSEGSGEEAGPGGSEGSGEEAGPGGNEGSGEEAGPGGNEGSGEEVEPGENEGNGEEAGPGGNEGSGEEVEPGENEGNGEEVEPGENEGNEEVVEPGGNQESEEVVESGGNLGTEEKPGGNTVIGEGVGTEGATDNKVEPGQETGAASEPNNEVEPASEPDNNVESENKTNNKVTKVRSLKVKADRKKLTITWKKIAGAAGYELQISTKKNFKGAKTIKLGKNKTKYTLKDINGTNKYYVRIRAYKTIKKKGKSKKVYGSWVKVNINIK